MSSETDIRVLRNKLKRAREKIASLREKNAQLEATIKELQASQADDTSTDTEDSESDGLPVPFYDPGDGCYRCVECGFEVYDWLCQNSPCSQEHAEDPDYDEVELFRHYGSMSTEDENQISDRQMAPRGDTPIFQDAVDMSEEHRPFDVSSEQYSQLIGRGASREMILQFQLHFEEQSGIFAWADQDLFDMYSTEVMAEGDTWKIALGRHIVRNHDDLDGSMFIEELLDEILRWSTHQWETVKDGDSSWVTRPKAPENSLVGDDSHNTSGTTQTPPLSPLGYYNGYESSESDNDEDDDTNQLMGHIGDDTAEEIDTETDWSAVDPTERDLEKARRDSRKSATVQDNGSMQDHQGGEDSTMRDASESSSESNFGVDEIDSDEPGSDWDSNDGIE
ncbi:hypothetical protein DL93DRAFT_2223885 [Clavulina sp. PMI_390]|nr:hypothetical protein DL93DRAFT_2223885 [Clavulina sp. PMI_390]